MNAFVGDIADLRFDLAQAAAEGHASGHAKNSGSEIYGFKVRFEDHGFRFLLCACKHIADAAGTGERCCADAQAVWWRVEPSMVRGGGKRGRATGAEVGELKKFKE